MGKINKKRVGSTPGVRLTQNVQDSQIRCKIGKKGRIDTKWARLTQKE